MLPTPFSAADALSRLSPVAIDADDVELTYPRECGACRGTGGTLGRCADCHGRGELHGPVSREVVL